LLKMARKGIRTTLTYTVDSDSMVLVVEIGNHIRWRRD